MRAWTSLAVLFLIAPAAPAQPREAGDAARARQDAIRYVRGLRASNGGYLALVPPPNVRTAPTLRATSAAVRALKYLTGEPVAKAVEDPAATAAFVMSCYTPRSGGFAELPGGDPDVISTSVGVMAAVELGVPKEKFRKAMDYLRDHAKTFEEVRLAAAAVEAWGVKDCPFDLKPWFKISEAYLKAELPGKTDGFSRVFASALAMDIRLTAFDIEGGGRAPDPFIVDRRADGGWGHQGAAGSDLETCYRVMRALHLMGAKPRNAAKLREFVAKCRNADGGYGVRPGETSAVGPTYYASIVLHWLDGAEAK